MPVPLQEACIRFRVFVPDDHQTVPRAVIDVMAALGVVDVVFGTLTNLLGFVGGVVPFGYGYWFARPLSGRYFGV